MAAPMQSLPATTGAAAARPCFWCNGSGRVPNDQEQRYDACRACEGSGHVLTPEPAERVAA
jgi:DnaJ-class molecular chaperone